MVDYASIIKNYTTDMVAEPTMEVDEIIRMFCMINDTFPENISSIVEDVDRVYI